jgi:hypothetical protein
MAERHDRRADREGSGEVRGAESGMHISAL